MSTPSHWRASSFWLGQTVSLVGDQISLLALPLTAVLTLHAGPAEHPVELSAGDFVRFPGDVPHLYRRSARPPAASSG